MTDLQEDLDMYREIYELLRDKVYDDPGIQDYLEDMKDSIEQMILCLDREVSYGRGKSS